MQASDVISRATDLLTDVGNVRWTTNEMLRWITDGQREVVAVRPEANAKTVSWGLTPSVTKQALPSDGLLLLDVVRNLGSGSTPGSAIRVAPRELLDAYLPEWHTIAAEAEVKHFTYDKRTPKVFYVYPRPSSAIYVELVYSANPVAVGASTEQLTLSDEYLSPLVDYVLFRARSKDAEFAGNAELAVAHYQAFLSALGARTSTEQAYSPNYNSVVQRVNASQKAAA